MTGDFPDAVPAIPAWEVRHGHIQGRQVLGLFAATTTSREFGALPASTEGMASAARQLGLARLTPGALRNPPQTELTITISARDVHLELHGRRPFTLTANRTGIEEALVRGDGTLLLVLGPLRASERSFAGSLRKAAAARSHFAGAVKIVDLRAENPEHDHYQFFASGSAGVQTHQIIPSTIGQPLAAILDLNILIALKKAIEGTSATAFDTARDLATTLRGLDVIPGFALAESFTSMTSDPTEVHRKLVAALDTWLHVPITQMTHASLKALYEANLRDQGLIGSTPDVRSDQLTDLNYAMLLHLALTWSAHAVGRFDPASRIEAYRCHIARFDTPGLGVSAYCLGVARILLFGTDADRGQMEKLLRLKSSLTAEGHRAALRAASWDLFYPVITDLAGAGLLEDTLGETCYLVTGDRPLARVLSRGTLAGMFAVGDLPTGIVHLEDSFDTHLTASHQEQTRHLEAKLLESALLRGMTGTITDPDHLRSTIAELERDLTHAF